MYAIVGATGNTGRVVAERLLDAGKKVRALVRSAKKAEALAARGAEVVEIDVERASSYGGAFDGVEGAYLLLPPNMATDDFLGSRARIAAGLVEAVKSGGVAHVVLLSSVGAHRSEGTGVIRTLYDFERRLRDAEVPFTSVRAAYFAENWASVLPAVRGDGVLPHMLGDAARKIPMVATDDIGRVAADALLAGPRAAGVIELEGTEPLSPNDIARHLGEKLGRTVTVVDVPFAAQEAQLESFGIAPNVAALFREMNEGIASGIVDMEGGTARHVRGARSALDVLTDLLG